MRIIAGTCRSLPLKTPKGMNTRPTTDRIKETLFNIIHSDLYDCRFLDLFAGSGAIGLEALSRGAREAVFIENNKEAIKCIEENIQFTKMAERSKLIKSDVIQGIHSLSSGESFDIIFMDPPYGKEYEKEVLKMLSNSNLADQNTLIVVEADLETDFSYLGDLGFEMKRYKKYKTNAHAFITRMGE